MMVALGDSVLEVADAVVHPEQVAGIHPPFHRLKPQQAAPTPPTGTGHRPSVVGLCSVFPGRAHVSVCRADVM